MKEWGIDQEISTGGMLPPAQAAKSSATARKVYLLQRKKGKLGAGLGKTTGWIHRTVMKKRGVEEVSGCKVRVCGMGGTNVTARGVKRAAPADTQAHQPAI